MNKKEDAAEKRKSSSLSTVFPSNPYNAGNPITDPKGFFGREDVFRAVIHMLHHPHDNAIVLSGQRRIGKTSILHQLKLRLEEENEYTAVYFDLQYKAAKLLGEVLCELAHEIAFVTGQSIPKRSCFDDDGEYFHKVFLPEAAKMSATNGLVLLFDEFDVLESHPEISRNEADRTFYPFLRNCMAKLNHVKFCFVIGRRAEELSTDASSFFKGARSYRISTLSRKDTVAVIRQAEGDNSLHWSDAAIDKVWELTQGHAYLTQLLCSVVWEHAYDTEPTAVPQVKPADVDAIIDEALMQGQNDFNWIWKGLPPAEQVMMAAMAEADYTIITQEKIREILNRSGVKLILPELELAPETLVKWELLREAEGGYCFSVALLRKWVAKNLPLRRVKNELDNVDEQAKRLFQTAEGYYRAGKMPEAEDQLKKALDSNRDHLGAMLLLGNVLLEENKINEAVKILKKAYQYDQSAASHYIKVLLASADRESDESEQLATYDLVLEIDPKQPVAQEGRRKIWTERGDAAIKQGEWDQAVSHFQEAGDKEKVNYVHKIKRQQEFETYLNKAEQHEKNKDWNSAIPIWKILIEDYKDKGDFSSRLKYAESQASLEQRYIDALTALSNNDNDTAKRLLIGIISQQTDYKEALWHLLKAQYRLGLDPDKLKPYKSTIKIEILNMLIREFSASVDFQSELEYSESQTFLEESYNEALSALSKGDNDTAKRLLVGVISQQTDYKEALWYLIKAQYGSDLEIYKFKPYKTIIKKIEKLLLKTQSTQQKIIVEPKKPLKVKLSLLLKPVLISFRKLIVTLRSITQIQTIQEKQPNKLTTVQERSSGEPKTLPKDKEPSQSKSILLLLQELIKSEVNLLWQKLIFFLKQQKRTNYIINLKKHISSILRFKHLPNWIVSSLIWLPLLIWTLWFSLTSTMGVAVKVNLWLLIIFFTAWIVTALIGYADKLPKLNFPFNIQQQHIRIIELSIRLAAPIIIAILSFVLAKCITLLLIIALLCIVIPMYVAWNRAGLVTFIIASAVAICIAFSIRSTMDPIAKQFGLDAYVKSRNSVAQIFIKKALANTKVSELIVMSNSLKSSLLNDNNNKAIELALALSDCNFLNSLRSEARYSEIFDDSFLKKVTQQLQFDDMRLSIGMATFLRRIPDERLPDLICQLYDSTKNERVERICLFVFDNLAATLSDSGKCHIKRCLEEKPKLPKLTNSILSKITISCPIDSKQLPDTLSNPSNMYELSKNLKTVLSQTNTANAFEIIRQLVAKNDSLKHLSSMKWYPEIYNQDLFSKLVPLLGKGKEGEIIVNFLCTLRDTLVFQPIFKELWFSNNTTIQIRCVAVLDKFVKSHGKRIKNDIETKINNLSQTERSGPHSKVTKALEQLCLKLKISIIDEVRRNQRPPMPDLADSLNFAIIKDRIDNAVKYINGLLKKPDSLKYLHSHFDTTFFRKTVSLLFNEKSDIKSDTLAIFLRALRDPRVRNYIYNEFTKNNKARLEPRQLSLSVLEGFTKSEPLVQRDIKTWLGVNQPFETLPDIETRMKNMYKKFYTIEVPPKPKLKDWVTNLKLSVKTIADRSDDVIADSVLRWSEVDTLSLLNSDEIFDKFYDKALDLLKKNKDNCIARSIALFLGKLQTKNENLLKKIKKFWEDKKNTNVEARRLCLVIRAGLAQNPNGDKKVSKWLEEKWWITNLNYSPKLAEDFDIINKKISQKSK